MYPAAEKRFLRINKITIIVLFFSNNGRRYCPEYRFRNGLPGLAEMFSTELYRQQMFRNCRKAMNNIMWKVRIKKNERFAKLIEAFGYSHLADQIRHDETIVEHEEFNAAKTWTEYINRLTGVLAGFCMLFTAIYSFTYWKKKKSHSNMERS
ncbi:hypothetical protein [Sphingobacterium daejeonense]|uniref:hypothetical protein n=1 Tax=Sphingobacterium daejeonense TaxID=371142 RepID=UPI0010C49E63|nr:Uncharacterised protein [Sphingobacterium daejeonense]